MVYNFPPKGPSDILSYGLDWTAWLSGDTIATSTWAVATSTLTTVGTSNTTKVATIKVSGGTVGTTYTVTNTITTTTSAETKIAIAQLRIE